jgi:hypothetical protein
VHHMRIYVSLGCRPQTQHFWPSGKMPSKATSSMAEGIASLTATKTRPFLAINFRKRPTYCTIPTRPSTMQIEATITVWAAAEVRNF